MVDTPLIKDIGDVPPPQFPQGTSMIPRNATPEEIAHMALYLASDESTYTTAAAFVVDGGWSAV